MPGQREALLERFRDALARRARTAREAVEQCGGDGDGDGRDVLRRELHTLKGEARMLGLARVSELVHVLEELAAFLDEEDEALRRTASTRIAETLAAVESSVGSRVPAEVIEQEMGRRLALLNPDSAQSEPEPAKPVEEPAKPPEESNGKPRAIRFTQTETRLIDLLCERVTSLSMSLAELSAAIHHGIPASGGRVERGEAASIGDALDRCRRQFEECATSAWTLRLIPVEPTLQELARHTRVLAQEAGKEVDVRVQAAGVQLERDVLDQLWDALLHMAQNAVAHGIEAPSDRGTKHPTGLVTIAAQSAGANVTLSVSDDGRGINPDDVRLAAVQKRALTPEAARATSDAEILELLFEHGFSTRGDVTALSGRGVGLDVVRSKVESLGGTVELHTEAGTGSEFVLTVPFAIAKERVLVAEVAGTLCGLPSRIVRGITRPEGGDDTGVLTHDGEIVPRRSLRRVFGLDAQGTDQVVLIVEIAGRRWALGVHSVLGEHDLIRVPADPMLLRLGFVAASALLEDGRLVVLPQLDALLRLLRQAAPGQRVVRDEYRRRQRVLVVDDSPVICDVVREILTAAGLEVVVASDGAEGLRSFLQSEPDLVVSDVEMPNMDGLALLQEVRRRSARLPVVMLTTRASADDRRRAAALGANAYLVKSDFHSGALIDTIRRFVDVVS